jgi:hypothetical protein
MWKKSFLFQDSGFKRKTFGFQANITTKSAIPQSSL